MLQEFYIKDLIETTENEDIYNIMNKRMFYCKNLENSSDPLGPPDICYLVKEIQSKGFFGLKTKKITKTGSYHYVYGFGDKALDVSKQYGVSIAFSDIKDLSAGFHLRYLNKGSEVELP